MINSSMRKEINGVLVEMEYQLSLFIHFTSELEEQMHSEEDEMKYKQIQNQLNEIEDFIDSMKERIKNFALIIGVKVNG